MNALSLLETGIENWNQWRSHHPHKAIDLSDQDLSHGYFFEGNFKGVNLKGANLQRVCLIGADLTDADLTGADLTGAYLGDANLTGTQLAQATLTETNLDRADLRRTNLLSVDLGNADISAAQLPDPNADPYLDIVFELIAKQRTSVSQPDSQASQTSKQPTKSTAYKTVSYRQSLLRQMIDHLPTLAHESERATAMRQQAIRQSAVLVTQAKRPPLQIVATTASPKYQPSPQNISAVRSQTSQNKKPSQTKKQPRNLARRKSDRRLGARISRQIQQQSGWAIAAGLLLAIGLPTGFYKLSEPPLSAQEIATSFALSRSLTGSSQVWAVATHPLDNGQSLVVGGGENGEIEIWNSQTGELVQQMKGHQSAVKTLAMSQSGDWLVSGGQDGLKVWQPETGELRYTLPDAQSAIRSVAISPNEQIFISSDRQGTISAWQLTTGEKLYSIENQAPVWSVAIAPNDQTFITGSSQTNAISSSKTQTLKQWDLATGQLVKTFEGHQGDVRSVAISPDGQTLVSGSTDETIKLWDLASGRLFTTLEGHQAGVLSLAISADGQTLASSSSDRTLKLWDIASQQLTKTLENEDIVALAFDPQQATLVSGGQGQRIQIWQ